MAQIPANPNPNPGGTAGAGGGANPPSNIGRAARAVGGIMKTIGVDTIDWTTENVDDIIGGLKDLLGWSVMVPVVLFFIAGWIGQIGVWIGGDAEWWLVGTCNIMTTIGGMIGAVLVTYLWTRLVIYGKAAAIAIKAGEAARNAVSRFKQREAERFNEWVEGFLVWARGWTAWYIYALMFFMFAPYYRNLLAASGVLMVMLLLAAVFSAQWSKSDLAKKGLVISAVLAGATFFLMMVWPAPFTAARNWTGGMLDRAAIFGEREEALNEVDRNAERDRTDTLSKLSENFSGRRSELERSMLNCNGRWCTAADEAEYIQLGQKITWIRDGIYLECVTDGTRSKNSACNPAAAKAAKRSSSSSNATSGSRPAVKRRTVSSGGRLPPPPRVAPTPRSGSRSGGNRSPSGNGTPSVPTKAPSPPSGDYGLGGLDAYEGLL